MISERYKQLEALATSEFGDIVEDADWEQSMIRNSIYRHDNAPHVKWSHISTFPRHCHDGAQDNVVESYLSPVPAVALREFLSIVRKKIIQSKQVAS
jgi:hypothetical protein